MEASAAATYVLAAHFNASFDISCSRAVTIPLRSIHASARLLASYSTGKVIIENKVVREKMPMPTNSKLGNALIINTPSNKIHITKRELTLTTGTKAER